MHADFNQKINKSKENDTTMTDGKRFKIWHGSLYENILQNILFFVPNKSHRFGMTWKWVKDDRIIIFLWENFVKCHFPASTCRFSTALVLVWFLWGRYTSWMFLISGISDHYYVRCSHNEWGEISLLFPHLPTAAVSPAKPNTFSPLQARCCEYPKRSSAEL